MITPGFWKKPLARVALTPAKVNEKTLPLPESHSSKLPNGLKERPLGNDNPVAKVLLARLGMILSIRPPVKLLTNRLPDVSKVNPAGVLNPVANVVFAPAGVNSETFPLPSSAR